MSAVINSSRYKQANGNENNYGHHLDSLPDSLLARKLAADFAAELIILLSWGQIDDEMDSAMVIEMNSEIVGVRWTVAKHDQQQQQWRLFMACNSRLFVVCWPRWPLAATRTSNKLSVHQSIQSSVLVSAVASVLLASVLLVSVLLFDSLQFSLFYTVATVAKRNSLCKQFSS